MKLLFDQNLSHRLVAQLVAEFPGSAHVRDVGLAAAPDAAVWAHAAADGFIIVSKDTDFQQRALLYGHPPKVVWVRLGNCSTRGWPISRRSRPTHWRRSSPCRECGRAEQLTAAERPRDQKSCAAQ